MLGLQQDHRSRPKQRLGQDLLHRDSNGPFSLKEKACSVRGVVPWKTLYAAEDRRKVCVTRLKLTLPVRGLISSAGRLLTSNLIEVVIMKIDVHAHLFSPAYIQSLGRVFAMTTRRLGKTRRG